MEPEWLTDSNNERNKVWSGCVTARAYLRTTPKPARTVDPTFPGRSLTAMPSRLYALYVVVYQDAGSKRYLRLAIQEPHY